MRERERERERVTLLLDERVPYAREKHGWGGRYFGGAKRGNGKTMTVEHLNRRNAMPHGKMQAKPKVGTELERTSWSRFIYSSLLVFFSWDKGSAELMIRRPERP